MSATMKAVRIHRYGDLRVLIHEDAPRPAPGRGEILVRVHAAGVNPVDWKVREGLMRALLDHRLPLILGWDVSGVVEEVGPGVAGLREGDEVYSRPDLGRDGSYAELIVIRASEAAPKPASIDHTRAAAVPLAALTAWQVLFDSAGLAAGQTVLIHAAAGGVGHFAVQLARWKGARVIGTASAANAEFVRDLGAGEVIDYRTTRFERAVRDVDVVLDAVGGEVQERSWKVLRKGGILVSIVSRVPEQAAARYGARGLSVLVQPNAEQLGQIARLIDSGVLAPTVSEVLPLAEARRAHELIQEGHTRGKIVLRVAA